MRLVDELRWLNSIVLRSVLTAPPAMKPISEVCAVKRAAADVLACAADLLEAPEYRAPRSKRPPHSCARRWRSSSG